MEWLAGRRESSILPWKKPKFRLSDLPTGTVRKWQSEPEPLSPDSESLDSFTLLGRGGDGTVSRRGPGPGI